AELRERVPPAVGQDHRVRGLPAPVEPDDRVDRPARAQPVHDGPLAGVAEPEIDDDVVHYRRSIPSVPEIGGSEEVAPPRRPPTWASALPTVPAVAESLRSRRPSSRS